MGGARYGSHKGRLPTKFKTGCNYAAFAYAVIEKLLNSR